MNINKVSNKVLYTHVILEYLNFKRQNELQNAKVIYLLLLLLQKQTLAAAEQLLEEVKAMHI